MINDEARKKEIQIYTIKNIFIALYVKCNKKEREKG